MPPAKPPDHGSARSARRGKPAQSSLELVPELAGVLTAIGNYVDAALRLDAADTRSARTKLRETLEKCQVQVLRADEIFRQLRDLLRDDKGTADQ